jgi:hypothetical protein
MFGGRGDAAAWQWDRQLTTTPAKATAAASPARGWWKPLGTAIAAAAIAQRSTLLGLGAKDPHRDLTFSAANIAEYRRKVYVTTIARGQHAMPGFDVLSGVFGVRPDGGPVRADGRRLPDL